jgi:hypothetical protein
MLLHGLSLLLMLQCQGLFSVSDGSFYAAAYRLELPERNQDEPSVQVQEGRQYIRGKSKIIKNQVDLKDNSSGNEIHRNLFSREFLDPKSVVHKVADNIENAQNSLTESISFKSNDNSMNMGNVDAKSDNLKSFLELALDAGTDKVTTHQYNFAYEHYLPDLRHAPVRFVEIGLGCDMGYGPGKSLDLWDRYFTHKDSKIFFMEYDSVCAEKLNLSRPRVTVDAGDQADVTVLHSFIEKHGGNFDVIVDDGGHTMVQQITSLIHLFPALSSGGLYFLEDLQTSYMEMYGGSYLNEKSTIEYIKKMIDGFYGQGEATEIINQIRSINCFHEICVFLKK